MTETLTFRQLMRGVNWDVAWGRVYRKRKEPETWRTREELRDMLLRLGDLRVEKAMPGYWCLMIWLDG